MTNNGEVTTAYCLFACNIIKTFGRAIDLFPTSIFPFKLLEVYMCLSHIVLNTKKNQITCVYLIAAFCGMCHPTLNC